MRIAAPLLMTGWILAVAAGAAPPSVGLEDLGEQLLGEDLLRQIEPQIDPPPAESDNKLPDVDELRRMLQQPGGSQDEPAAGDGPLAAAHRKMRQARTLIEGADLSGKTREVQGEVVDQLDKLIAELEQQCQNCQSSSSSTSSNSQQQTSRSTPQPSASQAAAGQQPGDKPSDQQGQPQASQSASQQSSTSPTGGAAATDSNNLDPQSMLKGVWGQLPERMRQQMLQSSSGEFLPKYRSDIEAYYKRLAAPQE